LLSRDPSQEEARLRTALSCDGVQVQAVSALPLSLEDVFVYRVMALERQEHATVKGAAA
jgi:ABC-2 type transport system ATP-binding protein